jgi:hypothetical protein
MSGAAVLYPHDGERIYEAPEGCAWITAELIAHRGANGPTTFGDARTGHKGASLSFGSGVGTQCVYSRRGIHGIKVLFRAPFPPFPYRVPKGCIISVTEHMT